MEAIKQSPTEQLISETPKEHIKIKQESNKLVWALLFLIFSLLALFIYFYIKGVIVINPSLEEQDTTVEEQKENNIEQEENEDTQQNEQVSLVTFRYDNPKWIHGFTFEYPNNWEVTQNDTTCGIDPVSKEELCDKYSLKLSYKENPSYYITLGMCLECSPGFTCIYPDSQNSNDNESVSFSSYEEFGNGLFRRGPIPSSSTALLGDLSICKKSTGNGSPLFSSSCGLETVTSISYGVDENPDEEIIKVMDTIIISLERIQTR